MSGGAGNVLATRLLAPIFKKGQVMSKVTIEGWIKVDSYCQFEQDGQNKSGKIVKIDPEKSTVTVKPNGSPAVNLALTQISESKVTPATKGVSGSIPSINVDNFKEEWERKYPQLGYGSKRPKYNVIEDLLNQPSVEINIPAGPPEAQPVITLIINQQYFNIPRGEAIQGPKQLKDMLKDGGYMDGQEMLMHTPGVRAQRGFAPIATYAGTNEN